MLRRSGFPPGAWGDTEGFPAGEEQVQICILDGSSGCRVGCASEGSTQEPGRLAVTGGDNSGLDEGPSNKGKDSSKETWMNSKDISSDLGR